MKKIKNTILLVFLFIIILFSSLLFYLNISDDELDIILDLDYVSIIKKDKEINEILDRKKVPKEIFNYIDNNKVKELFKDGLNNDDQDISNIIIESINEYDSTYKESVFDNFSHELKEIIDILNTRISEINELRLSIKSVFKYRFIILALILLIGIILIKNGEEIKLGLLCLLSSIILYASFRYISVSAFKGLINNNILDLIIEKDTKVFMLYLVGGVILLELGVLNKVRKRSEGFVNGK